MAGSIFLESMSGLIEMKEEPWEAEARLQELLAQYPNMLAGEQMNETSPRRWVLVSREFGIPGEIEAAGRWSLDHLFLDQDAVPTLVEVKRSTDTRIRREVVGQMFDYASHLVSNVSAERIRQKFEGGLSRDEDPATALTAAFDQEIEPESFWQRLKDNIAANKLRLVFVADEFPPELRRIVEFLNRQMQLTEVLAVEVRQYVSPDKSHRTLVPRLIGKVESKSAGSGPGQRWDRTRFEGNLSLESPDLVSLVGGLIRLGTDATGRDVEWGMGRDRGSFTARMVKDGHRFSLFSVYTTGEVSINIGWSIEDFANLDPSYAESVRQQVNDSFGVNISKNTWERGWPMIPLTLIADDIGKFENLISKCATDLHRLIGSADSGGF